MKITVIIPTRNKLSRLKITLEALQYQNCNNKSFRVLVIDDGSTDGSPDFLKAANYSYRLDYILNKEQGGRSAARNIGIAHADSDFILFIDDDIILNQGYISRMICQLSNKSVDAVRGGIYELLQFGNADTIRTHELLPKDASYDLCIHDLLCENGNTKPIHRIKTQLEKITETVLEKHICEFMWLGFTGSSFACKRDLLLQFDGFDERMGKTWGCEDFELGYRFVKKHEIVYDPSCMAYHLSHKRINYEENLKSSFEYFYQKHMDSSIWRVYNTIINKDWRNGLWRNS